MAMRIRWSWVCLRQRAQHLRIRNFLGPPHREIARHPVKTAWIRRYTGDSTLHSLQGSISIVVSRFRHFADPAPFCRSLCYDLCSVRGSWRIYEKAHVLATGYMTLHSALQHDKTDKTSSFHSSIKYRCLRDGGENNLATRTQTLDP